MMLCMNKRGQGLSVNVIIIAAIALIVLVVLVAIFTGRLGGFSRGINEVTSCDQVCKARGFTNGGEGSPNSVATPPSGYQLSDRLIGATGPNGGACYCRN
ncbi:hypothetical protein J4212_01000 [Candidatus Woesearchaeota archaeon]|nr:hypothetical protein [Candidatus Woesearchaeota archaeon]